MSKNQPSSENPDSERPPEAAGLMGMLRGVVASEWLVPQTSESQEAAMQADDSQSAGTPPANNPAEAPKPRTAASLKVRCPHCHNPIEVIDNDPSGDVSCPSCGSCFNLVKDAETARYLQSGRKLGHFELLDRLGQGAFGEVWKARDTELDRIVAIKIPRREHLTEEETEQFLREARAAAQVRHPNIVSVYEIGREHGVIYIVSDFIDGATLDQWVQAHPLTVRESVELCAQTAEALHHAHEAGVVHRDLKPQNILVQRSGVRDQESEKTKDSVGLTGSALLTPDTRPLTPFITDFGLAKRDAGEITVTVEGAILGTPAFMSPEQARGEAHHADRRSDLYSLGVILFRLLTGELPFRGQRQMLIVQILSEEPPALRKLDASIPRDVETICLKCLEKDPARRYSTAVELAADLRRWLTGHPIAAHPVSRAERAWRWCRRNPQVASLSGTVVSVLVAGLVVSWFFANQSSKRAGELTKNQAKLLDKQRELEVKQVELKKSVDEKTERLWESYFNQAEARRSSQAVGQRFESLKVLADAAKIRPELILRNAAVACLPLPDLRAATTSFVLPSRGRWGPAAPNNVFDPVNGLTATITDESTVQLIDAAGKILHSLEHPLQVELLHWHPNGQYLAVGCRDTNIHLWRVPEGRRQSILEGHQSGINGLEFSPDGLQLLSNSFDGTSRLWDFRSGRMLLHSTGQHFFGPWSDDGQQLQNGGPTLEFANGRECRVLHHGTVGRGGDRAGYDHGIWEIAFSPDGRILATGKVDDCILWDVESGQELCRTPSSAAGVAFGADGTFWKTEAGGMSRWPVTVLEEGDTRLRVYGPPTKLVLTGSFRNSYNSNLAISRDGCLLAAPDRSQSCVWLIDASKLTLIKKLEQPSCMNACISPDGKLVVTSSWAWQPPKPISIHDWAADEVVHQIDQSPYARSVFSPDQSTLLTGSQNACTFWDCATWKPTHSIPRSSHLPGHVDFSSDGRLAAISSTNYLVRLVDPRNGDEIATLTPPELSLISAVKFSPQGTHLAVVTESNRILLWDLRRIRQYLRNMSLDWDHPALPIPPNEVQPVYATFVRDGDNVEQALRSLRLRQQEEGRQAVVHGTLLGSHNHGVTQLAVLPGNQILSCSFDGTMRLWQLDEPRLIDERSGLTGGARSLAVHVSPNREVAVRAAAGTMNGEILIWKLNQKDVPATRLTTGTKTAIDALCFMADGTCLISGAGDTLTVWDLTRQMVAKTISGNEHSFLGIAVRADGERVATVGAKSDLVVWDPSTWQPVFSVHAHPLGADGVAYSSNGRFIATGGVDGLVRIWDGDTGRPFTTLRGHRGAVIGLQFAPGDRFLATSSHDRTLRLWDLQTRTEVLQFVGHNHFVRGVAFTENATRLVSCSWDKTIRLWSIPTDVLALLSQQKSQ